MIEVEDQIGRLIKLEKTPTRIVSVVPSQTEMLCDLGLKDTLVGVTKFCVHPGDLISEKRVIGGTKKLQIDAISELQPDLIVANKEENTKKDIDALSAKFPVYVSDIATAEDSFGFASDIGKLTGKSAEAEMLIDRLRFAYSELKKLSEGLRPKKALYLIWKDPFMAAGTDTFISQMLNNCGMENILEKRGDQGKRYPALKTDEIKELDPEIVLFSSEPFPFRQKHIRDFETETGLSGIYVNGEIFSWYGSRILHTLTETEALLHEIDTISR